MIASASAFELLKVEKGIEKDGLHRDLITNFTWRADTKEELQNCGLVFIENVTKDTYIYLEEVKGLKGFEFWPHTPIDIEKPASVSEDHPFIWRTQLKDSVQNNAYTYHVADSNGKPVSSFDLEKAVFPLEMTSSVKYEIHLRYQPVGPGMEYSNISFGGDTQVKLSCDNKQTALYYFSENFR